jgi:phage-related protein
MLNKDLNFYYIPIYIYYIVIIRFNLIQKTSVMYVMTCICACVYYYSHKQQTTVKHAQSL